MRNALVFRWLSLAVLTATAGAQQSTIVPQVRTKPTADNKITAIELAAHFGLTTMRQPMYRMGELAVEKLFQRMENPAMPPSHVHFVPTIIVRGSCGMNKNYSHAEEFLQTSD